MHKIFRYHINHTKYTCSGNNFRANRKGGTDFGSAKNWLVALRTLAVALDSGLVQVSGCLAGLPTWITIVFGTSPVTVTALMAILLNLILPKDAASVK
ncbi:MAG: hypothetical protein RR989_06600 [Ruthenibacterium sp.]